MTRTASSTRRIWVMVSAISGTFAVAALLWSLFAVPALVKYPTDLDVTPRYRGAFTLFVDLETATPLATPIELPLAIERHIRSVGDESGSSRVVVEETITQQAGDLFNVAQSNVYVMDRRTLQNVADRRAYAFDPSNVVDRSGTYRLNLPFDVSPTSTYRIYKNEIGTSYEMVPDTTTPSTHVAGLHLRNFVGSATEVPVDNTYLAALRSLVPLPKSLTFEALKPQLQAAGLDVDALLTAIGPLMTPADLDVLAQLVEKPIPLQYLMSFDGRVAVETTTGAEVAVGASESMGVRPVLADVAALQSILTHYASVPAALAAADALAKFQSAPAFKLLEYHYEQTPDSVADIADEVKSMRNHIRLAERYVPLGMLAAAVLSLAIGAIVYVRRRGATINPRPTPHAKPVTEQRPPSITIHK
jgi:hypothetical protein